MTLNAHGFDPARDLLLERDVDVPIAAVWAAWTTPDQITKWFSPAPFQTVACDIDLRPGGIFRTVMRSPDGDDSIHLASYLEVNAPNRLVWTTMLGPDYRPITEPEMPFTAIITLTATPTGTRYSAHVMHQDAAKAAEHQAHGFFDGWSSALDQLIATICRTTRGV